MRIALTQSEGRLTGLEPVLAACGHEVIRSPLIQTDPVLTSETREGAQALLTCPWLLFTSVSGVKAWHALGLPFRGIDTRLGTVGETTAAALRAYGGEVALVGEPQNAEGLAHAFLNHTDAASPVGLPQGNRSLPILKDRLEAHGFTTQPVIIYRTITLTWNAGQVDVVVLASPSAVRALPEEVGSCTTLVTLGPSTARAVQARGWQAEETQEPNAQAVLDTLQRLVTA